MNSNTYNNTDEIRRVVREELSRTRSSASSSLFTRTQDLLQSAAQDIQMLQPPNEPSRQPAVLQATPRVVSTQSTVGNVMGQQPAVLQPTPRVSTQSTVSTIWGPGAEKRPKRHSVPGHPNRFKSRRSNTPVKCKTFNVVLYAQDVESKERYLVDTDDEILNGFVELSTNFTAEDIRVALRNLFLSKFDLITTEDFEFMKRDKKVIYRPSTPDGFVWCFDALKTMCGQGKLYCRLKTSIRSILVATGNELKTEDSDIEEIDFSQPSYADTAEPSIDTPGPSNSAICIDTPRPINTTRSIDTPGPSNEFDVVQLQQIFPSSSRNYLVDRLQLHGNVADAALSISSSDVNRETLLGGSTRSSGSENLTLADHLKALALDFEEERKKLKIEPDDIINDAFAYYKSFSFNPKMQLQIRMIDQPAADTGGVARQFFTSLLQKLIAQYFEGSITKLPTYNISTIAAKVMKYIGMIVVHSVLHGGPGLPVFCEGVYYYLVTGDADSMDKFDINDCTDGIRFYIEKIISSTDLNSMSDTDCDEIIGVMGECGLTCSLSNENRWTIVHGLMLHDVVLRRKVLLDQFSSGLEILGFRDTMRKYYEIFKPLLMKDSDNVISKEKVLSVIRYDTDEKSDRTVQKQQLTNFINGASCEILKQFLVFVTGAPVLPEHGLGKIDVVFDDSSSAIFATTCLQGVVLPTTFSDQNEFSASMLAVIEGERFSSV